MSNLKGRSFSFSIIVHNEPQSSLLNFHQSSPILNVRSDCPPQMLLDFLISESGSQAHSAANEVHNSRAREEALLESVRQVTNPYGVWFYAWLHGVHGNRLSFHAAARPMCKTI